jgi:hypothetical protein
MSKPDPSITANLLKTVLGNAEHAHESDPKVRNKAVHPEAHADPVPKSAKPKSTRSAAGAAHMRSSNRGK